MPETNCPFCCVPHARIVEQNDFAFWIFDAYPVSPGHSLIIPMRHISSYFDLSEHERTAMLALLDRAKKSLDQELAPHGFNIGINDGPAAGQTVPHLHMHLIPRFEGDVADPRGGIRWVIPEKAKYWP